jgi:type II secretory pathway pseudopilin PulG
VALDAEWYIIAQPNERECMRPGYSLMQMLIVLAIIAVFCGIAIPRLSAARDGSAVRGAATQVVTAFALARSAAVLRASRVAVVIDSNAATLRVLTEAETLHVRALRPEFGVTLEATRDSVAYGPTGRGYGAANSSIILRRGAAVDTVFVSRLGRVRH